MIHQVKDEMSTGLITVGWGEQMSVAHQRMARHKIRHLPVTNEQGIVVGILSDRDVSRAMVSSTEASTTAPADETIEFAANAWVRDYMSWPVKTFSQTADIRVVVRSMLHDKISAALVDTGNEGPIVGIVTSEDLMRLLLELLNDDRLSVTPFDLKSFLFRSSQPLAHA